MVVPVYRNLVGLTRLVSQFADNPFAEFISARCPVRQVLRAIDHCECRN